MTSPITLPLAPFDLPPDRQPVTRAATVPVVGDGPRQDKAPAPHTMDEVQPVYLQQWTA